MGPGAFCLVTGGRRRFFIAIVCFPDVFRSMEWWRRRTVSAFGFRTLLFLRDVPAVFATEEPCARFRRMTANHGMSPGIWSMERPFLPAPDGSRCEMPAPFVEAAEGRVRSAAWRSFAAALLTGRSKKKRRGTARTVPRNSGSGFPRFSARQPGDGLRRMAVSFTACVADAARVTRSFATLRASRATGGSGVSSRVRRCRRCGPTGERSA